MTDLIKQWKENERRFDLCPKEMQDWANKHGKYDFENYQGKYKGWLEAHFGCGFCSPDTYRLKESYVEEPDTIEFPIEVESDGNLVIQWKDRARLYIEAPAMIPKEGYRFAGYKYENKTNLYIEHALYLTPEETRVPAVTIEDDNFIVFPTHAVYRKVEID